MDGKNSGQKFKEDLDICSLKVSLPRYVLITKENTKILKIFEKFYKILQ